VTVAERRGESISQLRRDAEFWARGQGARRPEGAAISQETSRPDGGQYPEGQRATGDGRKLGAGTAAKLTRGTVRASVLAIGGGKSLEV